MEPVCHHCSSWEAAQEILHGFHILLQHTVSAGLQRIHSAAVSTRSMGARNPSTSLFETVLTCMALGLCFRTLHCVCVCLCVAAAYASQPAAVAWVLVFCISNKCDGANILPIQQGLQYWASLCSAGHNGLQIWFEHCQLPADRVACFESGRCSSTRAVCTCDWCSTICGVIWAVAFLPKGCDIFSLAHAPLMHGASLHRSKVLPCLLFWQPASLRLRLMSLRSRVLAHWAGSQWVADCLARLHV